MAPMGTRDHARPARRRAAAATLAALAIAGAVTTGQPVTAARPAAPPRATVSEVAPLRTNGRWFVDHRGRVTALRGVNEVYKSAPYYPSAHGFGADDARFLADNGFNTVRLGVNLEGLMPTRGKVSYAYIDHLATSVHSLAKEGIYVVLDFHQDGFAPKYNGNGFPNWMAIDDGLPNPKDAVFPLYYVQNPAMQRAWESFWANRKGSDGIGLQDHFMKALRAVATRFANEPNVVGYETINEPFPGKDYGACLTAAGCTALEQARLAPFARRVVATVRSVNRGQFVWVEPFVLFNFGQGPTSLAGTGTGHLLAAHSYAIDRAGELAVVANTVRSWRRDQKPVLITEFGAVTDPVLIDRMTGDFDRALLPWIFWHYSGEMVPDLTGPADLAHVTNLAGFTALVRPYARSLTGIPRQQGFSPTTLRYDLTYTTTSPLGKAYPATLDSVIFVPALRYPSGYQVQVTGATVTSAPGAQRLTVRTDPGATEVRVTVLPPAA